jgi:hypothetical protein
MEKFQESRKKAAQYFQNADHMMYMTYKVVKDPKLLLTIMDSVFLALTNAMNSVLHAEHQFKNIPKVPEGFEAKFMLFRDLSAQKYSIDDTYLKMIRDVKEVILLHKTSPVEFTRKDKYVICSDSYEMQTITVEKIKEYLRLTKDFVKLTEDITKKRDSIFRTAQRSGVL